MNDYRDEFRKVSKEAHWTFWKVVPLFLLVVGFLALVGFGLRSCGVLGGTIVERKVFENSYQRSESLKSQIATDEATLAEIEIQLQNPDLDKSTRNNLNAQKAAARLRIRAAKGKQ